MSANISDGTIMLCLDLVSRELKNCKFIASMPVSQGLTEFSKDEAKRKVASLEEAKEELSKGLTGE